MRYLLAIAICFSTLQLANADELRETYVTKISSRDHYSSKGNRLKDAASIIRQDRANFHKFNKIDTHDEYDSYFESAKNRAKIAKMLRNGLISKSAKRKILNGTPTIVVYRYTNSIQIEIE